MYSSIQTWVNARITAVNALISGNANDLDEISTGFITAENAGAESDKRYQVKIESAEYLKKEGYDTLLVNVVVEFAFLITNDNGRTKYANMFKAYLNTFVREVVRPTNVKTTAESYTCYGLYGDGKPEISDTNEFSGQFILPKVSFTVRVGDGNS